MTLLHGVREYWALAPGNRSILLFRPGADGRYDVGELRELTRDREAIESKVLEGFLVDPEEFFTELGESADAEALGRRCSGGSGS